MGALDQFKSAENEDITLFRDMLLRCLEKEVIPHYDKFLGWLPDRVSATIILQDADATLLGIDEDTALVFTDAWRKYGPGKVHVLRGSLEFS